MNDKQGDSLVAAIEGNFAGMSHGDLVLTCEMLTRGRAAWQKECEEAHAVLDDPECLIIRNEKDGYPEGRPDRTLTLAERVRALLRMKVDYKRWMTSAEQERDSLRARVAELEKDKERLDWGQKNFARVALGTPQLEGEKWTIFGPSDDGSDDVEGSTLRESIDAAMSAKRMKGER